MEHWSHPEDLAEALAYIQAGAHEDYEGDVVLTLDLPPLAQTLRVPNLARLKGELLQHLAGKESPEGHV